MSKILDKLKAILFSEIPASPLDDVTDNQVWALAWEAEELAARQAGLWGNWRAIPRIFVKIAQDNLSLSEADAKQLWNQSRTQNYIMRLMRIQGCAAAHLPLYSTCTFKEEPITPIQLVGDVIIN